MRRTELGVRSMLAGSAEALVLFHGCRQFHGGQELTAGPLAAPAGLGAHSAVLVHPGMPLALVAAALAAGHAGLQERLDDVGVVLGLAADDPNSSAADVSALQAQPDARDELGDVRLAQVGVGVGRAGLAAVAERVDGGGQHAGVDVYVAWIGFQHLPGVAHSSLLARLPGQGPRLPYSVLIPVGREYANV